MKIFMTEGSPHPEQSGQLFTGVENEPTEKTMALIRGIRGRGQVKEEATFSSPHTNTIAGLQNHREALVRQYQLGL